MDELLVRLSESEQVKDQDVALPFEKDERIETLIAPLLVSFAGLL